MSTDEKKRMSPLDFVDSKTGIIDYKKLQNLVRDTLSCSSFYRDLPGSNVEMFAPAVPGIPMERIHEDFPKLEKEFLDWIQVLWDAGYIFPTKDGPVDSWEWNLERIREDVGSGNIVVPDEFKNSALGKLVLGIES